MKGALVDKLRANGLSLRNRRGMSSVNFIPVSRISDLNTALEHEWWLHGPFLSHTSNCYCYPAGTSGTYNEHLLFSGIARELL